MKTCFSVPMRITQIFGNILYVKDGRIVPVSTPGAIKYYSQWGLSGHDGMDVVPESGTDFNIYCFFAGIIVLIQFNHPAYGNRVAIYNPDTGIVEYHNHMKQINTSFKLRQEVKEKTLVGIMGNTGGSFGAHDHIGTCQVNDSCFDKNGIITTRLNLGNGFAGWLNPQNYIS